MTELKNLVRLGESALRLHARRGATRGMAIALLVVVALAGMGLGFAADRLALQRGRFDMRHPEPVPGFGSMEGRRGREGHHGPGGGAVDLGGRGADGMRERFARELGLTPDQQRRVDSIMSRQMTDFRRLRAEMQPRFDSLLTQAQSGLDSVLTPAQREKLRTLRAREAFGPRDSFGGREFRGSPPRW